MRSKMMKSAFALLWAAVLGVASLAAAQTTPDLESLAKNLTQQLAARQFDPVVSHFDETMTSAMSSGTVSSGRWAPSSPLPGRKSRRLRATKQCW